VLATQEAGSVTGQTTRIAMGSRSSEGARWSFAR
jgi:hypothetical protein